MIIRDNVTVDEVEVKNMEIAIENVARRRRMMAMQLIILAIWEEETEEDASGCIRYVTNEYQ